MPGVECEFIPSVNRNTTETELNTTPDVIKRVYNIHTQGTTFNNVVLLKSQIFMYNIQFF